MTTKSDAVDPVATASSLHPTISPTFALTFDTELIWGSFDHTSPQEFERRYPDIRSTIRGIVAILDRHQVSATWAVVGHLFLSSCHRDASGRAHPELVPPRQSWRPGEWYDRDPCTDLDHDPLWYGPDVLDLIQSARTPQEIGCHSFGHALYGDPLFSREAAVADVGACVRLARERGIELRSFVFPRNFEGHHDVLRDHGFRAFRGTLPTRFMGWPRPVRRVSHFATHVLATTPPVSAPSERLPGLWDIPGSMLFMERRGVRSLIPRSSRLRQVRAGLSRAKENGGVFHLWTHPFNLASDPAHLLSVLDAMLEEVARRRDQGSVEISTMGELAARLNASE